MIFRVKTLSIMHFVTLEEKTPNPESSLLDNLLMFVTSHNFFLGCFLKETSLDFNYVKPCLDLVQL